MKKIIIVLALSMLALVSAFADLNVRVELATDIVRFNTKDIKETVFFQANRLDDSANKFTDSKVEFKLATPMLGALVSLELNSSNSITIDDLSAWGKLGTLFKIQIGNFENRAGNRLRSVISEYDLGILQYYDTRYTYDRFRPLQHKDASGKVITGIDGEGNNLENFVVDFYLAPVTLQLMGAPTKFEEYVSLGGRVYANIGDFVNINVTARYFDDDKSYRTVIGSFLQFPNLIANLNVLVGFTASPWVIKHKFEENGVEIDNNTQGFDQGIDLRAEIPVGNIKFATHNNLSLYGDAGDDKKYMTVSNEVKAKMPLTDLMAVSLALQSHYYNNPSEMISATAPKTFYDFATELGFFYTLGDKAKLETGLEVRNIGNDNEDIIIAIPFNFTFWF